jgi:glycerol-3-phosphate dehydrogenase
MDAYCHIAKILNERNSVSVVPQIRYAVKEYACTAIDVIARRLRLAFLNVQAAQEALPAIIDILAEELKWSNDVKKVWYLNIWK